MIFGKRREARRQWALLGTLLRSLRLLDALDFMDRAFGAAAVPWLHVRDAVAAGGSLSEVVENSLELVASREILPALRTGEADGSLAAVLEALGEPEDVDAPRAADEGVVRRVNEELSTADGKRLFPAGPDARRIWILAGQPYWAPKAGSFRMKLPSGELEFRATPGPGGAAEVEVMKGRP